MQPPEEELEMALRRRARSAAGGDFVRRAKEALAAAEQAIARSHVLSDGRRLARDPAAMSKRCAWCGRFTLGGAWLEPEEARRLAARPDGTLPEISHTICQDCSERLVRERKSH